MLACRLPCVHTYTEVITPMSSPETIPVLSITDDGRDVDDVEALVYFAGQENVQLAGIVTTHMIPDRRAFIARAIMNNLGVPVPIGVGSVYPLGKEDPLLTTYLRQHTIKGATYEGDGLIECFPPASDVIHNAIDRHGPALRVAVQAPLTDLAQAADQDPGHFSRIGGIFIQGQATIEDGRLIPDPAAYNLGEDMEAAERIFAFQDQIPMTFLGKYAAYQVPLHRADFDRFADTGNHVGSYLRTHAIKGIQCFAERAPDIFQRVFGVEASQLDQLEELSKPYDALLAKALVNPAGLQPVEFGHHRLIGMTVDQPGILEEDRASVKADICDTIIRGLCRRGF